MSDTDNSEVLETQEVQGYRRTIRRKKYSAGCSCPGTKGITTASGPAKLIPHSRYGASIWIHILIRKYRFQIPVARILKNLSLHGLSIPPGSAGDGLKRLAPLFEPVYAALEERSERAAGCFLSSKIPGFRRVSFPEKTVGNSRVLPCGHFIRLCGCFQNIAS